MDNMGITAIKAVMDISHQGHMETMDITVSKVIIDATDITVIKARMDDSFSRPS
jgi:hypothetical protein